MKIPHPTFLIIVFYMIAQSLIIMSTTKNIEALKTFLIGSTFLLLFITVLLMWTGGLMVEYKRRRT
jgi:hypothetical protein